MRFGAELGGACRRVDLWGERVISAQRHDSMCTLDFRDLPSFSVVEGPFEKTRVGL